MSEDPFFPGATAISGLSVYDWEAEDGLCGGSPHMHLTCTEAYVAVSGAGAVHTVTAREVRETPLRAGTVVWFGPGTIHRAVNDDGSLRVLVVMQNAGLPEAGDAVFTFPSEVLADPAAYREVATLSGPSLAEAARARRDLAVRGYQQLVARVTSGDETALAEFYRHAVALVADRTDEWERRWRAGPVAAVRRTEEHLAALRAGRIDHLLRAGVRIEQAPTPEDRKFGMCGRLDTYSFGHFPPS